MRDLTDRQKQILAFIRGYVTERGYPPSIRDIGVEVGLSSSSTVHSHLQRLERKGYLSRAKSKPRSLQLAESRTADTIRAEIARLQAELCALEAA